MCVSPFPASVLRHVCGHTSDERVPAPCLCASTRAWPHFRCACPRSLPLRFDTCVLSSAASVLERTDLWQRDGVPGRGRRLAACDCEHAGDAAARHWCAPLGSGAVAQGAGGGALPGGLHQGAGCGVERGGGGEEGASGGTCRRAPLGYGASAQGAGGGALPRWLHRVVRGAWKGVGAPVDAHACAGGKEARMQLPPHVL
eukprot:359646-Chlamydomonas_euryale.AAC.3